MLLCDTDPRARYGHAWAGFALNLVSGVQDCTAYAACANDAPQEKESCGYALLLFVTVPAGCWGVLGLDRARSTVVTLPVCVTPYMTA